MFRGTLHLTKAKDTNQETLINYMTGYVDQKRRVTAANREEAMIREQFIGGASLFALAAAAPARADESVAVIVKATTSEYWQWVFKGAEAAGKELGIKVEDSVRRRMTPRRKFRSSKAPRVRSHRPS